MTSSDTGPLHCFFPSNRVQEPASFLGHASPWALHREADRLEIGVFADGLAHFEALMQALLAATRGHIGTIEGLRLVDFEHQQELVEGAWQAGLPVRPGQWHLPEPPVSPLRLELRSPLRIRLRGRDLRPDELTPKHFATQLMRRASALLHQAGQTQPEWQPHALLAALDGMGFEDAKARHTALYRYSSRQRQGMRLHGMQGQWGLPAGLVGPFWPLWWMGQALHVGKTPCLGTGRYRLHKLVALS